MILTEISYLVGIYLGEKGLPPSIIAPVLNILRLVDEGIVAVGIDFTDPELEKELDRLSQAIVLWNHPDSEKESSGLAIEQGKIGAAKQAGSQEISLLPFNDSEIVAGLKQDILNDELAFLDKDDLEGEDDDF